MFSPLYGISLPQAPGKLKRHAWALLVFAAAVGVRFALNPVFGTRQPFTFLFVAVAFAAWYAGRWAAAAVIVLGIVIDDYLFMSPQPKFGVQGPTSWVAIVVFAVVSIGIIAFFEAQRRAVQRARSEIAAREATQNALLQSEQRRGLALDAAELGIWSWDARQKTLTFDKNSRHILGLSQYESGNGDGAGPGYQTYNDVLGALHVEDRSRVARAVRESLDVSGQHDIDLEYRVVLPDQRMRWVRTKGRIYSEDGANVGMHGTLQDITLARQTEEALRQTEKLAAVGRMASSIAHEINNPLESVTNLLYLIEQSGSFEEIRDFSQNAQRELSRVANIVTQTLRFHRHSAKPVEANLSETMASVISLYQGRLLALDVSVERQLKKTEPLLCYESELRQVFANLIGNALDASQKGGRLLLRKREAHHPLTGAAGIRITIADTGSGMSKETKQRLFEPFFTTKEVTGTGLGLWISHSIVEKHEGTIRVRSSQRAEHHGTVFSLFFPFQRRLQDVNSEGPLSFAQAAQSGRSVA
jgi:signal transduction histidine kinase